MNNLLTSSKVFVRRNGSTILTCIGGTGVVVTAVMAVKATPKAMQLLDKATEEKGEALTKLEKVKVAGPVYIPAVLVGVGTLACVFGASMLTKRNQASLMSAYALLDSSYNDYKNKVKELYGEDGDKEVRQEIAKDKYSEADILREPGKVTFYDEYSRRFFQSTIEAVQKAEYQLNRDLVMQSYATINDFYIYLNIPPIDGGDEVGWTPAMNSYDYWQEWVDFSHEKMVDDDGLEYYILRIFQEPRMNYGDF